jgi:hypothetical protein
MAPSDTVAAARESALEYWRVTHRACVNHLRTCVECGVDLCPNGQTLWNAADEAERALPWRVA